MAAYKQLNIAFFFLPVVGAGKECRSTFSFSTTTRGLVPDTRPAAPQPTELSGLTHAAQRCSTFQLDYLCAVFFSLCFLWLQNPLKRPSVSLSELEFKWVDLKIKDLTHSLTPPPQVQSSKLKLHIRTVSELLCLCVGWRGGHRTHIMSLSKAAEWEFESSEPAKRRWMELVSKWCAYF